jgi:predicted membrane-bound mannosyltransferase/DNA-binding beta-propeller fold protein YncE
MSHDESLHTYFSWLLFKGQGYQHTPMMHGPYQFHLIALSYFLFGVSDFTARIPAVLFSIATVWMVWYWRRYLGTWGMIVAAFLMVISPYMLYYGRYVRNESFVGFSGILLLYAVLRYLEAGEKKYLYIATLATVLHFTSKETAFIYTAQALLFLGVLFLYRVTKSPWENHQTAYRAFIILVALGILLAGIGFAAILYNRGGTEALSAAETAAPANPTGSSTLEASLATRGFSIPNVLLAWGFMGVFAAGLIYIRLALVKRELPRERSFDLLVVIFSFVIPQLTAFVLDALKIFRITNVTIPTDAASVAGLDVHSTTVMGIVLTVLFLISITLGLLWDREWWKYGALFWGIFTVLYTTVFTNVNGFFTGVVGSLGYWLVQQGVERGSQPSYYYWLVQIPMYEFLPAIGSLAAFGLGLAQLLGRKQAAAESDARVESETEIQNFGVYFWLMAWWCFSTVVAFSVAGEKMPWLTYHMAWPMAIFTGWAIGQIIESLAEKWDEFRPGRSMLAILVFAVFTLAAFNAARAWFGPTPPFRGTDLVQLQATSAFMLPFLVAVTCGWLLYYFAREDPASLGVVFLITVGLIVFPAVVIAGIKLYASSVNPAVDMTLLRADWIVFLETVLALAGVLLGIYYIRTREPMNSPLVGLYVLTLFGLLGIQTMRTSFRASYINYDNATEYLVYAHAATGVKEVLAQVSEISERTAGGLDAVIAYDASAPDTGVSWPVVWYLRDFTQLRSFDQPSRSLREAVAVIVDQKNFDKIEPALGDGYYRFDYIRMWWPNQDYFHLTNCGSKFLCKEFSITRIAEAVTNPGIREGIFDIWFNRDYTTYAQAVGSSSMTLTTWSPADQMRLYVRKDIAAKIWNYGVGPALSPIASDPYQAGSVILTADQIFNSDRYGAPGLSAPRAIARGLNADFYIADSRNHRILHIASDGSLLHEWGSFAAVDYFSGVVTQADAIRQAPLGTFNEPWGVAVGPDGYVYVTDTWNHRVQKFTEDGKPVKAWGQYGQPVLEIPETAGFFWGPRGIAVDAQNRIYVADTGNKRIVVFDSNGKYLTEFGTAGFELGQFDEPVGVAVAPSGTVYVTDTWNQRVQAFVPSGNGDFFIPVLQWDVNAWFGIGGNIQSLDNKPFIAVGENEHIFITDPEGFRIIEFTPEGQFVRAWGGFGSGSAEFGLAAGVTVDQLGFVWVTDAGNNRIMKFKLP